MREHASDQRALRVFAGVVRDGHPSPSGYRGQPLVVWSRRREVVAVHLNIEARRPEGLRKRQAKVAVGEVNDTQAARS